MIAFRLTLPRVEIVLHEAEQFEDDPHVHENAGQLLVPLCGRVRCHTPGRSREIGRGQAAVRAAGTPHWHTVRGYAKSWVLTFDEAEFRRLGYRPPMDQDYMVDAGKCSKSISRWANLYAVALDRTAADEIECEIFEFLRGVLSGPEPSARPVASAGAHLDRAIEYVHEHYRENIPLDTLARVAGYSKYHFIRAFRRRTGLSPHQYILRLRVRHAKELLKRNDRPIQDISDELGFSCTSHFYRVFMKIEGVSPGACRGNT